MTAIAAGRRRRLDDARGSTVARIGRVLVRARRLREWAGEGGEMLLGRCAACSVLGSLVLTTSTDGPRAAAAAPLGLWLGARMGRALHDRAARAHLVTARRALPEVLDRLSICVVAGMSVERALRVVEPGANGALGDAIRHGLRALDIGVPKARAYELIAERAALDEVRGVMAALARAERFGTSVSDTLVAQAREFRSRARAAAEADARTAPVKLIFPLVFCFLPAFVVLTIAPIALSAIRTIGGI